MRLLKLTINELPYDREFLVEMELDEEGSGVTFWIDTDLREVIDVEVQNFVDDVGFSYCCYTVAGILKVLS